MKSDATDIDTHGTNHFLSTIDNTEGNFCPEKCKTYHLTGMCGNAAMCENS